MLPLNLPTSALSYLSVLFQDFLSVIFFICLHPDVSNSFGNAISDAEMSTVYLVCDEESGIPFVRAGVNSV